MSKPHSTDRLQRRRVLLAVTGMSPQVVTETVYALACRPTDPWVPDEVRLITTARGGDNARLQLLSDEPGWFRRLCREWQLPPINFDNSSIQVVCRPDGKPLDDIRDDADNLCVADTIAEAVRAITANEDIELHASMAGGRKTMGYYLGYALSLYGRPWDRLSHVLVSTPFEGHSDFFYPSPQPRVIPPRERGGDALDASRAEVWLGDIPFVRLRQGLPRSLLAGRSSFGQAVAAAQGQLLPPRLRLDLAGRRIVCGETTVALPPAELAFLSWFARRLVEGQPSLPTPKLEDHAAARAYLLEHRRIVALMDDHHHTHRRLAQGMDKTFFEQRKSKLKKLLVQALGEAGASPYLIRGQGRPMGYALPLTPEAVSFEQTNAAQQVKIATSFSPGDDPSGHA